MGSNSHSDYPYKMNNSVKVGSYYNRTTNTSLSIPSKLDKTNEFFYLIGDVSYMGDPTIRFYRNQTLSIQTSTYDDGLTLVDNANVFDLSKYKMPEIDYFQYFFKNTRFNNKSEVEQTTKYSVLGNGSQYINSSTVFKGIKYNIKSVKDVIRDQYTGIKSILTDNTITYNNYKLTVILSDIKQDTDNYVNGVTVSTYRDGDINIYLNDKHKNVLVVIYTVFNIDDSTKKTDVDRAYSPSNNSYGLTASSFINRINDPYSNNRVFYHYIDINGSIAYYENPNTNLLNDVYDNRYKDTAWGKNFPPFILSAESADEITTKRKSFQKIAVKGPKYNIYDKYKVDYNEIPYDKSFIKYPLSVLIQPNEDEIKPTPQKHGEKQEYVNKIYRFSGPYEPIFKDIELFEHYNYVFFASNTFSITRGAEDIRETASTGDINWYYKNKLIGVCDGDYSICDLYGKNNDTGTNKYTYSSTLVCNKFDFNIPSKTIINKIELHISKKADISNNLCNITDNAINMVKLDAGGNIIYSGNNMASATNWKTVVSGSTYTFMNNNSFTYEDINNDLFGVAVRVKMKNENTSNILNSAYIDCIRMTVYYTLIDVAPDSAYFGTFDKNYKFNTDINCFGYTPEQQFSKVNHTENVLKIKNNEEDKSIYPMVDEFGLQYGKRFIFKGTFDSDFYVFTKNEIE